MRRLGLLAFITGSLAGQAAALAGQPAWIGRPRFSQTANQVESVAAVTVENGDEPGALQRARQQALRAIAEAGRVAVSASTQLSIAETTVDEKFTSKSEAAMKVGTSSQMSLMATSCPDEYVDDGRAHVRCILDKDKLRSQLAMALDGPRSRIEASLRSAESNKTAGKLTATFEDLLEAEGAMRTRLPASIELLEAFLPDERTRFMGATPWEPDAVAANRRSLLKDIRFDGLPERISGAAGEPASPAEYRFKAVQGGRLVTDFKPEMRLPAGTQATLDIGKDGVLVLAVQRLGRESGRIALIAPRRFDVQEGEIAGVFVEPEAKALRVLVAPRGVADPVLVRYANETERALTDVRGFAIRRLADLSTELSVPITEALEHPSGDPLGAIILAAVEAGEILVLVEKEDGNVQNIGADTPLYMGTAGVRLRIVRLKDKAVIANERTEARATGATEPLAVRNAQDKLIRNMGAAIKKMAAGLR